MLTLIIGGSGSGKSAYAEDYTLRLAGEEKKYYIATMQVYDEECERKIERHRLLRSGKGFETIEQPTDIAGAAESIPKGTGTVLLECLSNLTANEMFAGEKALAAEEVTERIWQGIMELNKRVHQLVIVSNNIFEDGNEYDKTTREYIRAMGELNKRLAVAADSVVEVVVGLGWVLKPITCCLTMSEGRQH